MFSGKTIHRSASRRSRLVLGSAILAVTVGATFVPALGQQPYLRKVDRAYPCELGQKDCPWLKDLQGEEREKWEKNLFYYQRRGSSWQESRQPIAAQSRGSSSASPSAMLASPSEDAGMMCGGLNSISASLDLCGKGGCQQAKCNLLTHGIYKGIWICSCIKAN